MYVCSPQILHLRLGPEIIIKTDFAPKTFIHFLYLKNTFKPGKLYFLRIIAGV